MYQNIVSDIPDEGEESVILLVVHRVLDLRVVKPQIAPRQCESVQQPQRSEPSRFL